MGLRECISQKQNPVWDPANDSQTPRGKKSIVKPVLGSRAPPDLRPRTLGLSIRQKANTPCDEAGGRHHFVTTWH